MGPPLFANTYNRSDSYHALSETGFSLEYGLELSALVAALQNQSGSGTCPYPAMFVRRRCGKLE